MYSNQSAYCRECRHRFPLDADGKIVLHSPKDRAHLAIDGYCKGALRPPRGK